MFVPLVVLSTSCSASAPAAGRTTRAEAPKWLACPTLIMGLSCELPVSWTIDDLGEVAVASAKASHDDALVALLLIGPNDVPEEVISSRLPVDTVAADATKTDRGRASLGTKTLEWTSTRLETARGIVLVVSLSPPGVSPEVKEILARVHSGFWVVEAPKPKSKVPHDLAGRPLAPPQDIPPEAPALDEPMPEGDSQ